MGGLDLRVILTDKFPNRSAFAYLKKISGGAINFVDKPVDVIAAPPELEGVRTLRFAPLRLRSLIVLA